MWTAKPAYRSKYKLGEAMPSGTTKSKGKTPIQLQANGMIHTACLGCVLEFVAEK